MRIINIFIMGIAMVAMLAFGGTFAYFTAKTGDTTATTTTGVISITRAEAAKQNITLSKDNVLPKENLLTEADLAKLALSAADATRKEIVFLTFNVAVTKSSKSVADLTTTVTYPTDWTKGSTNTNVYAKLVEAGATSVTLDGLQIALDGDAQTVEGVVPDQMGATVTLTITVRAVQAVGSDGVELTSLTAANVDTFYGYLPA